MPRICNRVALRHYHRYNLVAGTTRTRTRNGQVTRTYLVPGASARARYALAIVTASGVALAPHYAPGRVSPC